MAAKRKEEKHAFIDNKQADEAALLEQRRADCARIDAEAQRLLQQSVWSAEHGFESCLTGNGWTRDGVPTASRRPQTDGEVFVEATTVATREFSFLCAFEDGRHDAFLTKLSALTGTDLIPPAGPTPAAMKFARDNALPDPSKRFIKGRGPVGGTKVAIRRSIRYWRQAYALLDGCMSETQFNYHVRELMERKLQEAYVEREREIDFAGGGWHWRGSYYRRAEGRLC